MGIKNGQTMNFQLRICLRTALAHPFIPSVRFSAGDRSSSCCLSIFGIFWNDGPQYLPGIVLHGNKKQHPISMTHLSFFEMTICSLDHRRVTNIVQGGGSSTTCGWLAETASQERSNFDANQQLFFPSCGNRRISFGVAWRPRSSGDHCL